LEGSVMLRTAEIQRIELRLDLRGRFAASIDRDCHNTNRQYCCSNRDRTANHATL